MSDPKIIIETEESQRPIVEINNLPEKTDDVIPTGKTFNFKEDSDDESSISLKSTKSNNQKNNNPNSFNYEMYADPRRMAKKELQESEEEEFSESEEDSESEDESDNFSEGGISKGGFSQAESEVFRPPERKVNISPAEMKIKKKELLLKLHDAEQSGYQITGKYNMNSPIDDLEAEYSLYERRMEQNAMVDLLQDGLMFIIKGIEMFNGFYKPMGVNLVGLSDKIYDRREQLEHVLKRLAIKYSGGTDMPPELSLLFIIGGAMVMTHISNTALSSGGLEKLLGGLGGAIGGGGKQQGSQENPIMNMMSGLMKNMGKPKPANQPQNSNIPQQDLKPPSLDINSLLSKMNDVKPTKPLDSFNKVGGDKNLPFINHSVPSPNPFPKMTRDRDIGKPGTTAEMPDNSDRFSVTSDISSDGDMSSILNVAVPSHKKGRGKKGKGSKTVFQI